MCRPRHNSHKLVKLLSTTGYCTIVREFANSLYGVSKFAGACICRMPRAPSAQSGPSAVPTVPPGARCLAETHRARVPRAAGTHSQHVPLHPCARSPSRRAAHGRLSSCLCRWHKVGAAVADVCLQVRCARRIARGARWQPNRCVYGPETATPILRAAHARVPQCSLPSERACLA